MMKIRFYPGRDEIVVALLLPLLMLPFPVMPENMSSGNNSSLHHIGVNYLNLRLYSVNLLKYAKIYRGPLHLQFNLDISFISLDRILPFLKYIAAVNK